MNRKEPKATGAATDTAPTFDPGDFVHGSPSRFSPNVVTIAARIFIQRHEIPTADPMATARDLAAGWLAAQPA